MCTIETPLFNALNAKIIIWLVVSKWIVLILSIGIFNWTQLCNTYEKHVASPFFEYSFFEHLCESCLSEFFSKFSSLAKGCSANGNFSVISSSRRGFIFGKRSDGLFLTIRSGIGDRVLASSSSIRENSEGGRLVKRHDCASNVSEVIRSARLNFRLQAKTN